MERILDANYPVLRQNKGVLLKQQSLDSFLCILLTIPSCFPFDKRKKIQNLETRDIFPPICMVPGGKRI